MIFMPTLEQGRIVWAELTSSDGAQKKCRPAVVITATSEIDPKEPFIVVAATTKFTEPLADDQVLLPWHPNGNVRTRLQRPTVAVCSWLAEILATDIVHYGGI